MKKFSDIHFDLLKKYNRPGPRYTSYPTAPLFNKDFGPQEFEAELKRINRPDNSPLSLYFHIPFCDTLCYFCGCTMLVTQDRQKIRHYLSMLEKEIDLFARYVSPDRKVTQIHWGGGTPTYLNPDEIVELGSVIRKHFSFEEGDVEASCEIDPRGLTRDHVAALREAGFNRISMGVQDFNEKVQKAVNRIQPESITRLAMDWAREMGFKSQNLDLIYGLPFQTPETFEATLDKIIELSPDRIAVFNYAHVPWLKKHMRLIHDADLPGPDQKLLILKETIERLCQAGYVYIGMDHFAKPQDELAQAQKNKTLYRNFQGYSTRAGCDVYALGMSAISQFHDVYAQNVKTIPEYEEAVGQGRFATHVGYRLNPDDHLRRKVIMRLMCDFELDEKAIEKEFGISFEGYFADSLVRLEEMIGDGLLIRRGGKIIVQDIGRLLIRNIAMAFDAYLESMMKEKPVFSKTV